VRHCTPEECEHCIPWGQAALGKTRCTRPPVGVCGFRFSTTLGAVCPFDADDRQPRLWEEEP